MRKLSREEWERKVSKSGNGRFDFVRWAIDGEFGSECRVIICCKLCHFEWGSTTNNITSHGNGCPQCAKQRRWTSEERIQQINKLGSIDFVSWVCEYKGSNSKANVKCSIDGYKWSASVSELVNSGKGCPQCAGRRIWTPDERIDQINKRENLYFVSWVGGVYENKKSKATVRCSVDGFEWSASVDNLVNRESGCPKCAKYGYDASKPGYLYALRSECGQHVKVGISNKPSQRHKQLEKRTPFKFHVIKQISGNGDKIIELEKYFHNRYESAGFSGYDGATEWLLFSEDLLGELRGISIEHE